jgi:hypothetical protein
MDKLKSDRGDVPGWVLITLMTAGLIVLSLNRVIGVSRFRHSFGLWVPHFSLRTPELRMIRTMTLGRNPSK